MKDHETVAEKLAEFGRATISLDEDEDSDVLTLTEGELILLWEDKILSDLAFILLALMLDRTQGKTFNLLNFKHRWRGTSNPEKIKELTDAAILKAAEKLEKLDRIAIQKTVVQLELL